MIKKNISRLQLGISNPNLLPQAAITVFSDGTWVNLGEASSTPIKRTLSSILGGMISWARRKYSGAFCKKERSSQEQWNKVSHNINVLPFWWENGKRLPFRDDAFDFIFSEHFFEHLFMDEAYELFLECKRVLNPKGVFRISVPDADLRTYAAYEPLAFNARTGKTSSIGWDHPDIHKTRWNIYSLSLLLNLAGFRVIPLIYCDRHGQFHSQWPEKYNKNYSDDCDWELISADHYLKRKISLIVDAVRDNN